MYFSKTQKRDLIFLFIIFLSDSLFVTFLKTVLSRLVVLWEEEQEVI